MKTVSKFIINKDDNEFLYVEKCRINKKRNDMKYLVYSSRQEVYTYSDHIFHSVHSIDEKISIEKFTRNAVNELTTELYDTRKLAGYNHLLSVYNKVSTDKDKHNPNVKGVKDNLLQGLKIYNEFLLEHEDFYIPYEENYILLESDKTMKNEKHKVKGISNLTSYVDEKYRDNMDNIPVKELVRIKKAA